MTKIKNQNILVMLFLFIIALIINGCSQEKVTTPFKFKDSDDKIELWENNKLVFAYQKEVKSLDGKYARNNYIHPLMSLEGDTLTEDFPSDHPHQRGLYWAWHQIYVDTNYVSDSWALKNFNSKLISIETVKTADSAVIIANLNWSSPIYKNGKPYLAETTTITTHKLKNDIRTINFKIDLMALVPNVSIGGSDNEKGYGGFSLRIKMPDNLKFTSEKGDIIPQNLQINAGKRMDFSAQFGKKVVVSGITIICNENNPNYPQPWILRAKKSMQNVVFPGKNRILLSQNKKLELKYSVLIHK